MTMPGFGRSGLKRPYPALEVENTKKVQTDLLSWIKPQETAPRILKSITVPANCVKAVEKATATAFALGFDYLRFPKVRRPPPKQCHLDCCSAVTDGKKSEEQFCNDKESERFLLAILKRFALAYLPTVVDSTPEIPEFDSDEEAEAPDWIKGFNEAMRYGGMVDFPDWLFTRVKRLDVSEVAEKVNCQEPVTEDEICTVLKTDYVPTDGPISKGYRFDPKWFDLYPWTVYSPLQNGVYCRVCAIFSNPAVYVRNQNLVGRPFLKFKDKMFGSNKSTRLLRLERHGNAQFHFDALRAANEFINTLKNKSPIIQLE
ncbi:unnamed protein product [Bursaphelenchus xylophilus]|uniref:(pine wood nematode) hypothetical protein n=1 Tax=Bursaphelenchus xylophilus TaxID=6326 RepID=A0A1I7S210_BURXY|nr:unnamed protein product [Bursaphelenchus xylophilus]CAG9090256.1 unnamed protein product [Bursaphelenchus xylophilus]